MAPADASSGNLEGSHTARANVGHPGLVDDNQFAICNRRQLRSRFSSPLTAYITVRSHRHRLSLSTAVEVVR
ncbi:unnamed protein product [Heligmosomoides polygyrus]|uniref:Uncharacterized protein n=1 Tax=Heligmosomoides polygyrus TaxID=6339 RepID=A0A183G188_HELPZ|nr:unnamed protein product [Heligmosomoides polygyrus]